MRIIAGIAKGRRLKTLKGLNERPTTDRVKESIFAVLGQRVLEADVLDLFAGTGNLGIEALSRGARSVLFIDKSARASRVIDENLHLTQFHDKAEVWVCDSYTGLRRLRSKGRIFDLIFADPPYGRGFGVRTILCLDTSAVLKPEGVVVLEHPPDENLNCTLNSIEVIGNKTFGQTHIHFYQCAYKKE